MDLPSSRSRRCPQNWTALQALETLSPPSPSPSGSFGGLATLASSGEIPIFLHAGCEEDKSRPPSMLPQRHRSMNFLRPSSSMATFHSTNTFGQPSTSKSRVQNLDVPTPDDVSEQTVRQRSIRSSDTSFLSTRFSKGTSYWNNRFSTVSESTISPLGISTFLEPDHVSNNEPGSPSGSDSGRPLPRASPSLPSSVSPSESIAICANPPYPSQPAFEAFRFPVTPSQSPHLAQTPSKSWSTISSSLLRRSLSPSPSSLSTAVSDDLNTAPSVRFRSSLLRRAFISRSPSLRSDQGDSPGRHTRSPSPSPLGASQQDSPLISPTSPRFATFSSSTLADTPTTEPGSGSSSNTRIHTAISVSVDLPEILSWLRGICFELWIDQEGFRRIQPKFRLVGYTPPSPFPDMSCDNELTHGIALFRPVRRETSIYHHGILDTLPTLRRLTLADREDKDYISRHASLTIKENGVYVVTGLEAVDDHPPSSPGSGLSQAATNFLHLGPDHAEPSKLRWRFEYMVEDRKSDSGRIIAGEKIFTPLSFACSPGLLHPSHGKRIRLMQVLMKNMSPKLTASKLTSTPAPYAETRRPVGRIGSEIVREVGGGMDLPWPPLGRARNIIRTLSGHRRTRSSEPASIPWLPALRGSGHPEKARAASLSGVGCPRQAMARSSSLLVRHRRDVDDFPPSSSQRHASPVKPGHGGTPGRMSRQILTREELAAILASFPTPGAAGDPNALSAGSHTSALSPPSYYRHRRAQSDLGRTDELGMVMSMT
ncbi:hypothetical protein V8D89_014976 [Ganoderma adspersum]